MAMYCSNCGAKLEEGQRFCEVCGEKVDIPAPVDNANDINQCDVEEAPTTSEYAAATSTDKPVDRNKKKIIAIASGVAAVVIVVAICLLVLPIGKSEWQKHYDKGMDYLDEDNYEAAIEEFEAAIELDETIGNAYSGLAQVYIEQDEFEEAIEVLENGYEKTQQDESIKEKWRETYIDYSDASMQESQFEKAKDIISEAIEKIGTDEELEAKLADMENNRFVDSEGNSYVYTYVYYPDTSTSYSEATTDPDGNVEFLKGKTIWYAVFEYTDGKRTKVTVYDEDWNERGSEELLYDENGNPTQEYDFDIAGGRLNDYQTIYDDEGRMTEDSGFRYSSLSGYSYRNEYIYEGDKISESIYYTNSLESIELEEYCETKYNYDNDGTLQETILEYLDGWKEKNIYSYDANGNEISRENYFKGDGNWEKGYRYTFEYDSSGNKISEKCYDTDNNLKYEVTY